MVKFKLGFTMTAETLFGMLSKMLPIEDLTVEEIAAPTMEEKINQLHVNLKHANALSSIKRKKYARRPAHPMDLTKGINRIILDLLEQGPHTAIQMKEALVTSGHGYSPNSIGSRLQSLEEKGIVKRKGDGTWKLLAYSLPPIGMTEDGQK
jgi:DNA-binding transcriptional ArsR family regulator